MSLKLIDTLLKAWDDSNYKGLDINYKLKEPKSEDLMNMKISRDIENQKKIKPNMTKLDDFQPNQLIKYYTDHNFSINGYPLEDHIIYDEYDKLVTRLIRKNTKNILEVGFNTGILTSIILQHTAASVVSFDLMNYSYSWYGKLFIDYKFPNKHTLILSTPNNLIPLRKSINTNGPVKYDVFWIRGDYPDLYGTIVNLRDYAKEHTLIVLESVCPHLNFGLEPYLVMLKLIKDKVLILEEHVKLGENYNNGVALLRYYTPLIRSSDMINMYRNIELHIPLKEFEEFIYNKTEDTGFNNLVVKKYLRKIMSLDIVLSEELLNYIKESFNIHIE